MRNHFRLDEEKTFKRLLVMKECIAEQSLQPSPCPLLASQLNELIVFADKMLDLARRLRETVKED